MATYIDKYGNIVHGSTIEGMTRQNFETSFDANEINRFKTNNPKWTTSKYQSAPVNTSAQGLAATNTNISNGPSSPSYASSMLAQQDMDFASNGNGTYSMQDLSAATSATQESLGGLATTKKESGDGKFLGMGNEGWKNILGAGQLALGLASYFDNKKINKKKMEVMDQNLLASRDDLKATQNYRKAYGA